MRLISGPVTGVLLMLACLSAGQAGQFTVMQAEERRQLVVAAEAPDGNAAAKVAWEIPGGGVGSFKMTPAIPLLPGQKSQVVSRLFLPPGCGLKSFNLRVEDISGETFQYYRLLPAGAEGWISLTNTIDTARPPAKANWGGNNDAVMDSPLSVSGIGFEFDPLVRSGHFFFDFEQPVLLSAAPPGVAVSLTDDKIKPLLVAAADRKQSMTVGTVAGDSLSLIVRKNRDGTRSFDLILTAESQVEEFGGALFMVRIYLPAPGVLSNLRLNLKNAAGEHYAFEQTLSGQAGGWQTVAFPTDGALRSPLRKSGPASNNGSLFPLRLHSLAGDFRTQETTEDWIAFNKLEWAYLPARLKVDFVAGNEINIVDTGRQQTLGWRITNPRSGALAARLQYVAKDIYDSIVASNTVPLNLDARSETFVGLPIPDKQGIYYVETSCLEEDAVGPAAIGKYRFAHVVPAGPRTRKKDDFIFGVCSHSQWKTPAEQKLHALAASICGVNVLREDFLWERMEPRQGEWNFAYFDSVLDTFKERGIEVAPLYCYRPDWAVAKDWKPLNPGSERGKRPDYQHWANFVRMVATRYHEQINFVEIWNEPDLMGYANFPVEEYIEMMRIAHSETKKIAPEVTVLTGGFTMMPPFYNMVDPRHMEKVLVNGKSFYDIHAFHVHGSYLHYKNQIEQMLALRQRLGTEAPWWANETAITATGFGEYVQAVTLIQKLIFTWARGAIGYNWFSLYNAGGNPDYGEHNFGLLTRELHPKAAFCTYNTTARLLAGGRFLGDFDLGRDLDAFLFKAEDGSYVIACWGNTSLQYPAVIRNIRNAVGMIDIFGNETMLEPSAGVIFFEVGAEPRFIRISGQDSVPIVGIPPIQFPRQVELTLSRVETISLPVHNPFDAPVAVTTSVQLPEGMTTVTPVIERQLAAGATAVIQFVCKVDPVFRSYGNRKQSLKVQASFADIWSKTVDVGILSATAIPRSEFADEPQLILDNISQHRSLIPNAPDLENLQWSGAGDLSAKVWLAYKADSLSLKVEVLDDQHVQKHVGGDLFNSDSIQIAIQPPEAPDFWEIGVACGREGESLSHIWMTPKGLDKSELAKSLAFETRRDEGRKVTTYIMIAPLKELGLTDALKGRQIGFNILVNDNDGGVREGYLEFSPGLGATKDASLFLRMQFEGTPIAP